MLSIVAFGLISLFNADELASGSWLAVSICAYIAVFWGIRLSLQAVLDVKDYPTTWWLAAGHRLLTVLFACLVILYGLAAVLPRNSGLSSKPRVPRNTMTGNPSQAVGTRHYLAQRDRFTLPPSISLSHTDGEIVFCAENEVG